MPKSYIRAPGKTGTTGSVRLGPAGKTKGTAGSVRLGPSGKKK